MNSVRTRIAAGSTFALLCTLAVGCSDSGPPTSPTAADRATVASEAGSAVVRVVMRDACDPATFNPAVGPGTCERHRPGVPFGQFLSILRARHAVGDWRFAPAELTMHVGDTLTAFNDGGEVHTFTEVDEFGGGIVPVLNEAGGTPDVAPECAAIQPSEFTAPHHTDIEGVETEPGTFKYQCCIHPWMRTIVHVTRL